MGALTSGVFTQGRGRGGHHLVFGELMLIIPEGHSCQQRKLGVAKATPRGPWLVCGEEEEGEAGRLSPSSSPLASSRPLLTPASAFPVSSCASCGGPIPTAPALRRAAQTSRA